MRKSPGWPLSPFLTCLSFPLTDNPCSPLVKPSHLLQLLLFNQKAPNSLMWLKKCGHHISGHGKWEGGGHATPWPPPPNRKFSSFLLCFFRLFEEQECITSDLLTTLWVASSHDTHGPGRMQSPPPLSADLQRPKKVGGILSFSGVTHQKWRRTAPWHSHFPLRRHAWPNLPGRRYSFHYGTLG